MELRFLQVERTPAGRQRAVVQIGGEATMEFSGTGGAAGNVDLSVDYGFNGNMKIDLETGQVQAIDLNGPMRLNHGANIGQGIVQRGDWTYRWEGTRLEPVATAAAEAPVVAREPALAGAGEPNPLDDAGPDPYTGTFKDDRLVLELKPTPPGYMGILRFGGKTFPVVAVRRGNALEGRFQSGNSEFPFTAATDTQGAKLTFTSGRTAHTLVKEAAVNPLEAPAATILDGQRDNPLAR